VSNRKYKIQLWDNNPNCYYCGKPTVLTNIRGGEIPPNAATIEHLLSRYNPKRWTRRQAGEVRKVLSCWECNQAQSHKETALLTKAERDMRALGFSLNPKGKPNFVRTKQNLDEVMEVLRKKGIDIQNGQVILRPTMKQKLIKWTATFLYCLGWNIGLTIAGVPFHHQWLYNIATR
jgi:hypothetical protein